MNRRFIYTVLLGMIIFNAMLLFLSDYFTVSEVGSGAVNVTTELSGLSPGTVNPMVFLFGNEVNAGGIIATIFGSIAALAGIVIMIATKHFVVAGALFFSAFVVFLFNGTKNIIFTLTNMSGNWIIEGMYTLITICIGVIMIFVIIDMFAPGGTTT